MSFFSSSSGSGGKNGEQWTGRLYFDPDAESTEQKITSYPLRDLSAFKKYISLNEEIIQVIHYRCNLVTWQWTQFLFCHQFIVFETEGWWWSIEKNSEGITVQRSKNPDFVKNHFRQIKRLAPINEIRRDVAKYDLQALFDWLQTAADHWIAAYSWLSSNCKHFTREVFGYLARSKIN